MAKDMTARLVQHFLPRNDKHDWKLLRFALGGLLYAAGARGANPLEGVDVEDLFSAVELLGRRNTTQVAPFIASWHSGLMKLEEAIVDAETQKEEEEEEREALRTARGLGVSKTLRDAPYRRKRTEGWEFVQLANRMLVALEKLVVVKDAGAVGYLEPLAATLGSGTILGVATLNYDNCVEIAAEAVGARVETLADDWTDDCCRRETGQAPNLLKLHGSVNWKLVTSRRTDETPMVTTLIHELDWPFVIDPKGAVLAYRGGHSPGLVFGQGNKLTPAGPFLRLLELFRTRLVEARTLTVVGYSFRDEHINAEIARWINHDTSHEIRIADPGFQWLSSAFAQELRQNLDGRLTLLEAPASEALATLYG